MSIEKITRVKALKKETIELSIKEKEIVDKIGMELFNLYNSLWKEKIKDFYMKMIKKSSELKVERNLKHDDFVKEMDYYAITLLRDIGNQLKTDTRIISAFSDKEEILNTIIETEISSTIQNAKFV